MTKAMVNLGTKALASAQESLEKEKRFQTEDSSSSNEMTDETTRGLEAKENPEDQVGHNLPQALDAEKLSANTGPLPRQMMKQLDWKHSLALLVICIGIYIPVMGSYGMFDPWETHYTEVARQFMVRNNWLETYWHNGKGPEGYSETTFWSKPVGSFWMSGLSLKLFGYSEKTTGEEIATGHIEWAVRLPFFLCGLFGIFCIYLMASRLFSLRAGILSGIIMATAPMYFLITRQAMTDMPYVGLMTGGLALFMLAVFGHREELRRKYLKIPLPRLLAKIFRTKAWQFDWPHSLSYYLFLLAFLGFMTLQLLAITDPLRRIPIPFRILGAQLSLAVGMVIYVIATLVFVYMSLKTRTKNEVYLYGFYMAVGIAGLAKGLVGALQPGMVILVYILSSREWRILAEVALARGLIVACCIFWPWYHGMVARYGRAFWNDLFGTEQLRRLTIGEQVQAKGTFEYYINQIGYGLFPWVAFLPAALLKGFSLKARNLSGQDRARLFLFVWFLATVALFTFCLTKYHHYILPALPPAAVLIALYLDDLLEGKIKSLWFSLLTAFIVLAMVAIDLVLQPAQWVWMFTYLYDSNWARGVPESTPILYFALASAVALVLLFWMRLRKISVWLLAGIAVIWGGYVLNWYQLGVAPNWSQKSAIATYYKLRKSPEEELVAWQFNWRGETWYTAADVVVAKSLDNKAIIDYLKKRPHRRFFFITERSRYPSLSNILPTEKGKKTLTIVDDTNIHYVLAAAEL